MKEWNCANRTEYNVKPRNKNNVLIVCWENYYDLAFCDERRPAYFELDEMKKKKKRTWHSREIYILGLVTHAATAPECHKHTCERVARGSNIQNYISQYSYVWFFSFVSSVFMPRSFDAIWLQTMVLKHWFWQIRHRHTYVNMAWLG